MQQYKSSMTTGQKPRMDNSTGTEHGFDIVWRWWWGKDWRKQRIIAADTRFLWGTTEMRTPI